MKDPTIRKKTAWIIALCERILVIHVMPIMVFTWSLSNLSSVYEQVSFVSRIETEKTQSIDPVR